MKGKKKPTTPKLTGPTKLLNIRTHEPQKNTASTNQKTFATIEQNIRTYENYDGEGRRQSLKARFSFNKKSCVERMEEINLSPFSDEGRSKSPKFKGRKTPEKLNTVLIKEEKEVKFAINLKELEKKKPIKSKVNSARQTVTKKLSISTHPKPPITPLSNASTPHSITTKKPQTKKKPTQKKASNHEQKARIQFQNEFLSMMNNRIHKQKITEMSDEQLQGSIRRKPKLQINVSNKESEQSDRQKKSVMSQVDKKRQIINTMKLKVIKNIQRDFPNLDHAQKKVICAVIIIQRLWRQRKVKQFFQHYVTPKSSIQGSFLRQSFQKQSNKSTMNLLINHTGRKSSQFSSASLSSASLLVMERKTCDPKIQRPVNRQIPKKSSAKPLSLEQNFLIREPSSQSLHVIPQQPVTTKKLLQSPMPQSQKESALNQQVNSLLQEATMGFQNENQKIVNEPLIQKEQMLKFIECYRQVRFKSKKGGKKVNKNKSRDVFMLKSSLSEKCLMQKYYEKIFTAKPQKDKPKNYELFNRSFNNSNKMNSPLKMNQQSSIQLFKEINQNPDYISPQKPKNQEQDSQEWIRNDTKYSHQNNQSDEFIQIKKIEFGSGQDVNLTEQGFKLNDQTNQITNKNKQQLLYQQVFIKPIQIKSQQVQISQTHYQSNQVQTEILEVKQTIVQEQTKTLQSQTIGIIINTNNTANKEINAVQKTIVQPSLKQIQRVANFVIDELMSEFFKEYISFQEKQCLVKKRKQKPKQQKPKKPALPGITITPQSITQYLEILTSYILNQDLPQVLRSLQLFHPSTYQKCHRPASSIYELFQIEEQPEEQIYWTIISNEGFFKCLEQFWKDNVHLTGEENKFMNFLDLTYKVYNRSVTDAFSQLFNKEVRNRLRYEWDHWQGVRKMGKKQKYPTSKYITNQTHTHNLIPHKTTSSKLHFIPQTKTITNQQLIPSIIQKVKQSLVSQCFAYSSTNGKLLKTYTKKPKEKPEEEMELCEFEFANQVNFIMEEEFLQKLNDEEVSKIVRIVDDEFMDDEMELVNCVDEKFDLKMELAEELLEALLKELEDQLRIFADVQESEQQEQIIPSTKSQNEIFLQTNQTLQTAQHA